MVAFENDNIIYESELQCENLSQIHVLMIKMTKINLKMF